MILVKPVLAPTVETNPFELASFHLWELVPITFLRLKMFRSPNDRANVILDKTMVLNHCIEMISMEIV